MDFMIMYFNNNIDLGEEKGASEYVRRNKLSILNLLIKLLRVIMTKVSCVTGHRHFESIYLL